MQRKPDEYVDTVWCLYANRAEERKHTAKRVILYAVTALVIGAAFLWAVLWARSQEIGTNLPLAPYSIDEATGEVMK
jgi:hypothetical protein